MSLHLDGSNVVSVLAAKTSDTLQANGILWVEGSSDRTYMNRWIQLLSDGEMQERRHYQCTLYCGALLARLQVSKAETAGQHLRNLLRVNASLTIACNSDRQSTDLPLNERVAELVRELAAIPNAGVWATAAKEIENRLPGLLLSTVRGAEKLPDPELNEAFFPRRNDGENPYLEAKAGPRAADMQPRPARARGLRLASIGSINEGACGPD